jgi:hypothetical protein
MNDALELMRSITEAASDRKPSDTEDGLCKPRPVQVLIVADKQEGPLAASISP